MSDSPRVEAVIDNVMAAHPHMSISAGRQARFYDDVHQELAPLARELERARRDFDLFSLVPADKRRAASDAVRMTMQPAVEILAAFVPKQEENAHIHLQQSLF